MAHVFLAGGSGVLGRRIVPRLVGLGHRVTVLSRTPRFMAGIDVVVGDALDRDRVRAHLMATKPDVVMHQLTDLSRGSSADNAKLRIDGTRSLVDAARAAGVRRMIVQSIAWAYEPGEQPAADTTPLDRTSTDAARRRTVDAVIEMEDAAHELDAVVLRNGLLYGPDTWYANDGLYAEKARAGQLPATADVTSFVHVDDAANAAAHALAWASGTYNVVDDEPASGLVWTPRFCERVSAPPPPTSDSRSAWARGAVRSPAVELTHKSWRDGF